MSLKRMFVPVCLALALGLAACGSDDDNNDGGGTTAANQTETPAGSGGGNGDGGTVRIAFSAPGADHGWMAAITENAREEADELGDVELLTAEGVTDSAAQADQIETLINQKPDALVVLPNEGDALTPVAMRAMAEGIPVVNVDREGSSAERS